MGSPGFLRSLSTRFVCVRTSFSTNFQMGNLKKRPPIGMEGVYDENSDYRGKKTNRIGKKHKVY
jgi:hypothetical protein